MFSDNFARRVSYLRVSVTDRCNFRCMYCMPEEGIDFCSRDEILTFEEIERIVAIFASHGVNRVRLSGGEPTLRRDLPSLVASLRAIDGIDSVVMTTNAFLLNKFAQPLWDAGLTGLNVSLDSLVRERFLELTRAGSLDRVIAGLDAAHAAGFRGTKINAVVIRGFNDDEIVDLVEWANARDLIPRFIEYMPIGGLGTGWAEGGLVPASEMRAVLSSRFQLSPIPDARLGSGPARYVHATGPSLGEDGVRVGFISAVTECFCADCNRVRLTPEGQFRACLADDGEVDLRSLMRGGASDEVLERAIMAGLGLKKETHRFDDGIDGATIRSMTTIGG